MNEGTNGNGAHGLSLPGLLKRQFPQNALYERSGALSKLEMQRYKDGICRSINILCSYKPCFRFLWLPLTAHNRIHKYLNILFLVTVLNSCYTTLFLKYLVTLYSMYLLYKCFLFFLLQTSFISKKNLGSISYQCLVKNGNKTQIHYLKYTFIILTVSSFLSHLIRVFLDCFGVFNTFILRRLFFFPREESQWRRMPSLHELWYFLNLHMLIVHRMSYIEFCIREAF